MGSTAGGVYGLLGRVEKSGGGVYAVGVYALFLRFEPGVYADGQIGVYGVGVYAGLREPQGSTR